MQSLQGTKSSRLTVRMGSSKEYSTVEISVEKVSLYRAMINWHPGIERTDVRMSVFAVHTSQTMSRVEGHRQFNPQKDPQGYGG